MINEPIFKDSGRDFNPTISTLPNADIERVVLQKLGIIAKQRLTGQMLCDLRFDSVYDYALNELVLQLHTYAMAEQCVDTHQEIKHPATWWDFIKKGIAMRFKFWRKRLKIKYNVSHIKISRYAVYPKLTKLFPFPENMMYVHSFIEDDEEWELMKTQ